MKSFQYYKLRAGGLGIVVALAGAWGALLGVMMALSNKDWAAVPAMALWGAAVAFIYGIPLGRWISREVESLPATIFLFILLVIPFFVLVWPVRMLALRLGWIETLSED
ncbi:MAG: hypothetical protein HZB56_22740 [Deltaproteobacteria bacterium]|nr:hypothetical protein [Deltaproteobacteria bacterium]